MARNQADDLDHAEGLNLARPESLSPPKRKKRPLPPHLKYRGSKPFHRDDLTANTPQKGPVKLRPSMVLTSATAALETTDFSRRERDEEPEPMPAVIDFVDMENHTSQLKSSVDINEPLFHPYPKKVTFVDYKAYSVYEQHITFRNNDSVPRRIKVSFVNTPFFEVSGMRAVGRKRALKDSKVAAGMEVCFVIRFKPQEVTNYSSELIVSTEREKFIVPVIALGERPLLEFPDKVSFDLIAVKSVSSRQMIVRNVGARGTEFKLSCTDAVFDVMPKEGYIDANSTIALQLTFTPVRNEVYSADLVVQYEGGQKMYVALEGAAENVLVGLSDSNVTLDSTYISLSSQRVIRIFNHSEIPVKFAWKNCVDGGQEQEERARLLAELAQMRKAEEQRLSETQGGRMGDSLISGSASFYDPSEELMGGQGGEGDTEEKKDNDHLPLEYRTARATINRKYRQLERALEEDQMLFEDEHFEVRPLRGEIWPGSEATITLLFRPSISIDYTGSAYLDVVGQEQRLPLVMRGHGIGPKAFLSYDVLDIGDVFVGSNHRYEMSIFNKGDIRCDWRMEELETPFGSTFVFTPTSGTLDVGQSAKFTVDFCSGILGEFSENFRFSMRGSNEPLVCQIKGHVLGPSFRFDVEALDFGVVSFDFINTRTFRVINTCEIPLPFALRIPQDSSFSRREFELTPLSGTIEPYSEQAVQVDFTSVTAKAYDYHLMVDVDGVGEGIASLPITADCQVPQLRLGQADMDYGEICLRYPYDREFTLINTHPVLAAKYEVLPQEETTMDIASYEGVPPVGAVPPNCEHRVIVRVVSDKLGSFRIPMMVATRGCVEPPLQVNICAVSRGPRIDLSADELKWGHIECLKDAPKTLTMTNVSTIPAAFKTFIKSTRSVFRIDIRDGVLSPGETLDLTLTANLDDVIVHKDTLHIIVTEGDNIVVPMRATGIGTTIFCTESSLEVVDFGAQLTNRTCDKRLTLENRGRRKQKLRWTNQTLTDALTAQAQQLRKMEQEAKKKDPTKAVAIKLPEILANFSVIPSEIELRPWTAVTYIFRGKSEKIGPASETFVCESLLGGEKAYKPVITTIVRADFMIPLMEVSESMLHFDYTWEADVALTTQSKPVTLTNRTEIPLSFVLRTQAPFSVDSWEHTLKQGESVTINVVFDPGYKGDKKSHRVEAKLVVAYANHPQRDEVQLHAEINFPNLQFEYQQVNFGCILNDTTKTMLVRVTNTSTVDTAFQWYFLEEDEPKPTGTAKKAFIPINQVFDILPIRSRLRPGEKEDLEFIYYGHAHRKFKATCVCEVEGGPDYEVTLLGEGSTMSFQLDRSFLDFGKIHHTKTEEKEFFIVNPSKVTFPYKISLAKVLRQGVVDVAPSSGRVFAGEKQRIVVRFSPGIPEVMCERLVIEVAHFDPIELPVYGEGVYIQVAVNLPRDTVKPPLHWRPATHTGESGGGGAQHEVTWEELTEQARKRLTQTDPSLVPLLVDATPPSSPGAGLTSQRSARSTGRTLTGGSGGVGTMDLQRTGRSTRLPSTTSRSSISSTASRTGRTIVSLGGTQSGGFNGPPSQAGSGGSRSRTAPSIASRAERVIRPVDVDMEANRIVYIRYLEDLQKSRRYAADGGADMSMEDHDGDEGKTLSTVPKLEIPRSVGTKLDAATSAAPAGEGVAVKSGGAAAGTAKDKKKPSFVLAWHVLDFGNVVSGAVKTMRFKVTNPAASGSLSWSFNKTLLLETGFTINPDKIVRLPEGGTVEFEVKLNAKTSLPLGRKEVHLPLEVKNGPATVVVLRAHTCVPEITLCEELLDFGRVYTGWARSMTIQLRNDSYVNAEWHIKKPNGVSKRDDHFHLSPSDGLLPPGHRGNVTVEFIPTEERVYNLKLPVVVTSALSTKTLSLTGTGVLTVVRFEPPMVELAPILPQAANEQEVRMINDTDRPIEVYSTDLDEEYLHEEEVLRASAGFAGDGLMRVPVRQPGEGLAAAVVKEYELKVHPPVAEDTAADDDEGLIEAAPVPEHDPTVREDGKAQDILLLGAPLSGRTTLATALQSQMLPYPILHIDDAIDAALKLKGSGLGVEVRHALGRPSKSEAVRYEAQLVDLRTKLAVAKTALEAAMKVKSRQRGKAAQEPPLEAAEVQKIEREIQVVADAEGLHVDLLKRVLEFRLRELDVGRGCIIDGLDSAYATQDVASEAVAAACKNLVTLHVNMNEAAYLDRLRQLVQNATTVMETFEKEQAAIHAAAVEELSATTVAGIAPDDDAVLSDEQSPLAVDSRRGSFAATGRGLATSPSANKQGPKASVTIEAYDFAKAVSERARELLDDAGAAPTGRAAEYFRELPSVLTKLKPPHGADDALSGIKEEGEEVEQDDASAAKGGSGRTGKSAPPLFPMLVPVPETAATTAEEAIKALLAATPKPLVPIPGPLDLPIPRPKTYMVLSRPPTRPARRPLKCFSVMRTDVQPPPVATTQQLTPPAHQPQLQQQGHAQLSPQEQQQQQQQQLLQQQLQQQQQAPPPQSFRWIIPANSSTTFKVGFTSRDVGRFDTTLRFEAVGATSTYALPCAATAAVPTINNDPRNVFMRRVKARALGGPPVSKRYVTSREVYDFGPLLMWKDPAVAAKQLKQSDAWKAVFATNGETLRLSNNGHFPAQLSLSFEGTGGGVFSVDPTTLSLAEGETKEVVVWAFVKLPQTYTDALLVNLLNNPTPYRFPLTAVGVTPSIDLHGQWTERARAQRELAASLPDDPPSRPGTGDEKGGGKRGGAKKHSVVLGPKAAALAKAKEIETAGAVIDFERLLLGKLEVQELVAVNTSLVPVAWRVNTNGIAIIEEFTMSPTEGVIPVDQRASISVTFNTIKEVVLQGEIVFEFSDVEGGLAPEANRTTKLPVKIKGEGYSVHFVPFDKNTIDYGNVRVGDTKIETVSLSNKGKYAYAFNFHIRKPLVKEVVKIEPLSGTINPGVTMKVQVKFVSTSPVTIKDSKDIRCKISEPLTGEVVEELTLTVSARSVYSAFRLQPSRGLNFGALRYNDPPKVKRLDIRNEGVFAFAFVVAAQDAGPEAVTVLNATAAAAMAPPPTTTHSMKTTATLEPLSKTIGHFTVNPWKGMVEPGQTTGVEVTFTPSGQASYKDLVQLLISGSDPTDSVVTVAKAYELAVDSCYPGIVTTDWRSTFEEQLVVASMDEHAAGGKADVKAKVLDGSFFCVQDQTFNFGAVVCSSHPKGVVERVRIVNLYKINTVVAFDISDPAKPAQPETSGKGGGKDKGGAAKAGAKKGGKDGDAAEAPVDPIFSVQPKSWDIPPHESRFVNIYFNPKAMSSYRGLFTAKAADAKDAATGVLTFTLAGAGTLPYVTVLQPKERSPQGAVMLNLGSVQVRKSKSLPLQLGNDGVVPVTVLIEAPTDMPADLTVAHAGGSVTLQPGDRRAVDASWQPRAAGSLSCTVRLCVMHNAYETTVVNVTGTAFERDVILEGLGEDTVNAITFPEVNLDDPEQAQAGVQVAFSMVNTSPSAVKFRWGPHPSLTFTPSRGHIAPGRRKDVTVRYKAAAPETLTNVVINLSTQRIAYSAAPSAAGGQDGAGPMVVDWDDTQTTVRPGTPGEIQRIRNPVPVTPAKGAKAKGKDAANALEMDASSMWLGPMGPTGEQLIVVVNAEPAHAVAGQPAEQPLLVTAVADRPSYECDVRSLPFMATAMYQAHVASFVVKNLSNTHLAFDLDMFEARPDGLPRPPGPPITNPFTTEPPSGRIPPKSSQTVTVRFRPVEVDVFYYVLCVRMPSLPPSIAPLQIALNGSAFRPTCHFELDENSDYLARRNPSLRNENGVFGPIEATTVRVVELSSVGINTRNVKKFLVMNTTNVTHEFVWEAQGVPSPAWKCLTPKGSVKGGRRGEMAFEYTPDNTDVAETFFKFRIQGQKEEELFLLVGTVTEPRVSLDRVKVDLNALIIGTAGTETVHIVNQEDVPFSFAFDKKLLSAGDGSKPILEITPASGMIPPRGRVPVSVTLRPDEEKTYNFNIPCTVRRKPAKLSLNLKGEGYLVHARILVAESTDSGEAKGSDADAQELVIKPALNVVDFGSVHLNEKAVRLLTVCNTGKFNYDYHIQHTISSHHALTLTGAKLSGTVRKGERVQFRLEFNPSKESTLEGSSMKFVIGGKSEYEARFAGVGVRPSVAFSFLKHDFGDCFISVPGLPPVAEKITLMLSNNDPRTTFSVDTSFQKTRVLDVQLRPTLLEPGQVMEVDMLFTPRAVQSYEYVVPFVIDGSTVVRVLVGGQGIVPKLELADPTKALVAFGQINEGTQFTRHVQLINKSKKAIDFELVDAGGIDRGRLNDVGVMVAPSSAATLGPRQSLPLEITFAPRKRVLPFQEDLQVKFLGQVKKLLSISGQCVGYDVCLEADALNFGTVCMGSSRIKRLQLANNGELTSRFRWDARTLGPHISISPMEGTLQPFSELSFEVTFCPKAIDDDIRVEGVQLVAEGVSPMHVTMIGQCVALPTTNVTVEKFSTRARKAEVRKVKIKNPTDKPWYLHPVLQGQHWKVAEEVVVPPKNTATVDITYWPLFMTQPPNTAPRRPPLTGSVFFALPNGDALLFNLEGQATEPEPQPTVTTTTPAKQVKLINLPVENWLSVPQSFSVSIRPAVDDPSVKLTGVQTIEVPAYATKEYGLRFYACKEGRVSGTVECLNQQNGEFVVFKVEVDVKEPEVIDTLELEAPVRQTARTLITIDNPLPPTAAVTFAPDNWWTSSCPHVRLSPVGNITGNSEGVFEVEYRPLKPTVDFEEHTLTFKCVELGTYKYKLRLKATPPTADPSIDFETPLGSSQIETFTFRVYNTAPAKLECKVQRPLFFTVAPAVEVAAGSWSGQDVKLTVTFEPEGISAVTDVLTVNAGPWGEYKCYLKGLAKPPLPQGPIRFNLGETKEVSFRNVFQEPTEFTYVVDSPLFVVVGKSNTETLPAKTTKTLQVTYQAGGDPKKQPAVVSPPPSGRVSAKLLVSAKSKPQLPPWIFYLQGSA